MQFVTDFTSAANITFSIHPVGSSRKNRMQFTETLQKHGTVSRNNGRYAKLVGWSSKSIKMTRMDAVEQIISRYEEAKRLFSDGEE
ncbi:MAG: hypothetical protein DHS20C11_19870 [Lysobacteraceae bacterium]|nr:MAG: hypothetical protein DHS20C11_19870 [Xanthomonadaceae bacterium]